MFLYNPNLCLSLKPRIAQVHVNYVSSHASQPPAQYPLKFNSKLQHSCILTGILSLSLFLLYYYIHLVVHQLLYYCITVGLCSGSILK